MKRNGNGVEFDGINERRRVWRAAGWWAQPSTISFSLLQSNQKSLICWREKELLNWRAPLSSSLFPWAASRASGAGHSTQSISLIGFMLLVMGSASQQPSKGRVYFFLLIQTTFICFFGWLDGGRQQLTFLQSIHPSQPKKNKSI